jgi:hypothetical protein
VCLPLAHFKSHMPVGLQCQNTSWLCSLKKKNMLRAHLSDVIDTRYMQLVLVQLVCVV